MATIDQQFVEYIVKSLVGDPDAVILNRRIDEKGVLLELSVAPDDLGRVIGKRGATAQSIRTLLRALGTKNDAHYNLKIIDPNQGERPPREERASEEPAAENEQPAAKESEEAPEQGQAEPAVEESSDDGVEEDSDRIKKTRQELEDLDDLDI